MTGFSRVRMVAVATLVTALTASCSSSSKPAGAPRAPTSVATTSTSTRPIDDELEPHLDNGAEGRNQYARADFVPPSKTCGGRLDGSNRSHVIRMLPKGPLAPDGSLAFTSGVCVYVPPGYEHSELRYPGIYLLHGGGGDAGDMVAQGHVDASLDALTKSDARNAAILVMPDGDNAQWYDRADRTILNETYVIDFVVPYIDRHFRTIATRDGRAIDGISNGGLGALLFAAKHAELFVASGSMSGNLDGLTLQTRPGHPGMSAHDRPIEFVSSLANTDLVIDIGSRCTDTQPAALCFTQITDLAFLASNRQFVAAARKAGPQVVDYRENEGAHAWIYWSALLRTRHLPFLLERLHDPTSN